MVGVFMVPSVVRYVAPGAAVTLTPLSYTWPAAHAAGFLRNDGAGVLSWSAIANADLPASIQVTQVQADTIRSGDGNVASPGMSFMGDTDSGWVRLGPDNIALVLGGAITHNFGAGAAGGTFSMTRYTDNAPEAARVSLRRARGTYAAPAAVQDADEIARITPTMYVNGAFREAARLRAEVVGTPGVGSYPLGWVFSTTADGSITRVDRFYIRPSGAVWVGTPPVDVGTGNMGVQGAYYQGVNQVVGARGAAVADADGTLASATTQLNALLARTRAHGLIAV